MCYGLAKSKLLLLRGLINCEMWRFSKYNWGMNRMEKIQGFIIAGNKGIAFPTEEQIA